MPPYKPQIYIETTIVSYLTAKISRNTTLRHCQHITQQWWHDERANYHLIISPAVIAEAAMGDPAAAKKRMAVLKDIAVLEPKLGMEELAWKLCGQLQIPERARADGLHLAYAIHYEADYLLTWNCTHLAGAHARRKLADFVR